MAYEIETTLDYYRDLLLYQYVNQVKARATIGVLVQTALCDFLPLQLIDKLSIETAEGDQLDKIGEYVGISRTISVYQDNPNYHRWRDYTESPATKVGFTDYTDDTVNVGSVQLWYYMQGVSYYRMTDEEYRYLIKFKIAVNTSDHSLYSISQNLYRFFGSDIVVTDNQNMSITYTVQPVISRFATLALAENILPKPAGVSATVVSA